MDAVASQDQQVLLAQLEQARAKIDEFALDLRDVDSEMEGLAKERDQYRLLDDACVALENLREAGAASLFWGERLAGGEANAHLDAVRTRVCAFQGQLNEIEGRRQAISEKIRREQDSVDFIEYDLFEAEQQEEQRKLEWIVEREISDLPARPTVMPWTRGSEDDERFRKSLTASLLVGLLLGLLLPLIDLPLPEPWETTEVSDRLVQLIREERALPSLPPVQLETKPEEKAPEPEAVPLVADEGPPDADPEQKTPSTESKGILAFRESFSGLMEAESSPALGAQARIRSSGEGASGRPQRSMVTTQAPGSSGGINLGALSRDVGGGGNGSIEGVQVTRATSSIGNVAGTGRPLSDGPALSRTDEEIQIVFDRHKAALYRLYNRQLRKDPTLKGKMILRIRIEPDGSVTLCEVRSTDMNAPQLSAQVVERVKTFDFGAKEDIPTITILYPIDFLPAT